MKLIKILPFAIFACRHLGCCAKLSCCQAIKPRYKRLVDNIFPANPGKLINCNPVVSFVSHFKFTFRGRISEIEHGEIDILLAELTGKA